MKACLCPPYILKPCYCDEIDKILFLILLTNLNDHGRALLLVTYVHSTSSAMEPTCVVLEHMGKDWCTFWVSRENRLGYVKHVILYVQLKMEFE
jgi:hypothetical protein